MLEKRQSLPLKPSSQQLWKGHAESSHSSLDVSVSPRTPMRGMDVQGPAGGGLAESMMPADGTRAARSSAMISACPAARAARQNLPDFSRPEKRSHAQAHVPNGSESTIGTLKRLPVDLIRRRAPLCVTRR